MKKIIIILSILLFVGCGEKINYKNVNVKEAQTLINDSAFVLDVRSRLEFSNGHIDNASNIDVEELEKNIIDLIPNKERKIVVYCQSGNRSMKASEILVKLGYKNIYNLVGGFSAYQEEVK